MSILKHTRPLKEVIAELQAMEDANPGIRCIANDNEWGADTPKAEISLVYVNEHDHVIITDEEKIKQTEQTIKEYTEQSPEEGWKEYTSDTSYEGMWKDFDEYKASHELVLNASIKDLAEMKTAVPVVIIRT